jgi:predicted alpha-1,6-mannanase (GH76 family)
MSSRVSPSLKKLVRPHTWFHAATRHARSLARNRLISRIIVIATAAASTAGCVCVLRASPVMTDFANEAGSAAAGLQRWYEGTHYRTAQWWQSATALEATIDYMRAPGSRAYVSNLSRIYRAHHDSNHFRSSYYDDDGWWALAWIKAYDLTKDGRYLQQARDIFAAMTGGWDDTCGGGIWWSQDRTYKNAIANELFLKVGAQRHNRVAGAVIRSPALSPHGVLREPCEASSCDADQPQFKGIFMGNLKALYNRTADPAYLSYLRRNADSVWRHDRRANQFGLNWAGPFDRPDAPRQSAALAALTAGIFVAGPARNALP